MSDTQTTTKPDVMASCCGPEAAEAARGCPCGSMIKDHKFAAFTMFSLFLLMFLISQVGGILAFVRTL